MQRHGVIGAARAECDRAAQLVARAEELHKETRTLLARSLQQATRISNLRTALYGSEDWSLRRTDRLARRVGRSPTIEEAKQRLMLEYGCSADEAFALLREVSQRENVKLREVATRVVEGGAGPRADARP